jgi:putative phosphoesterase
MKLGIISDTHNKLPENIFIVFHNVDIIFHAGDIGESYILKQLSGIAPVHAVYGNTDLYSLASTLPSRVSLELDGLHFLMQHNIGQISHFYRKLQNNESVHFPDVVIFGHTHHSIIQKVEKTLFMNPGSAGSPRAGQPLSVIIADIKSGAVQKAEIVTL